MDELDSLSDLDAEDLPTGGDPRENFGFDDHGLDDPRTVAEFAGVDASAVPRGLRYQLGSEPVTAKPRGQAPRGPRSPKADLDDFADHARAGVPDAAIARIAGVAENAVRDWRRRAGIQRPAGRRGASGQAQAIALALTGRPVPPVAHAVERSPVEGKWSPPEFTIRTPLSYTGLTSVLQFLAQNFTSEQIATALGFRHIDVITALRLAEARGHE